MAPQPPARSAVVKGSQRLARLVRDTQSAAGSSRNGSDPASRAATTITASAWVATGTTSRPGTWRAAPGPAAVARATATKVKARIA